MSSQPQPFLELCDVSKSFGSTTVLERVSLAIAPRDIVAVIGPSGSGKSTLLRCLNCLELPSSGSVFRDGVRIDAQPTKTGFRPSKERELREHRIQIGIVFQQYNLFPHMTAFENVLYGPLRVAGKPEEIARELATSLLARVGLRHRADYFPAELSGGQQQRVAIARALAMSPRMMLFDEITSALDPELVNEVLSVLRSLSQEGMTMVLATHELRFAREIATRILFMDEGKIVESGAPSDVLDSPKEVRTRDFLARIL